VTAWQSVGFDFLTKGVPGAERGFLSLGRAASASSDDVMGLARRLDEISKKSVEARVGLAGNKEALAELDKLDMKLLTTGRRVTDPKISIDGAAKASLEITGLDLQLDHLSEKSADAGKSALGLGANLGKLSNLAFPALIGAGTVLSPIIATVGLGTAGFGIAAAGAIAPVLKAAKATGGLQANMAKLSPEQKKVAQGLLDLQANYRQFEKALAPQVLKDFDKGLGIAGSLMTDLEPVSKATGTAIGGLLGRIDAELKSGTWQAFFGFMGQTAGPDIRLLGNNLIDLMNVLPPLLIDLQKDAVGLLHFSDAALKAGAHVLTLADRANAAGDSFNRWTYKIPLLGSVLKHLEVDLPHHLGLAGDQTAAMGKAAVTAAPPVRVLGTRLATVATNVTALMTAEQNSLTTQTTYAGDLVTTANDAKNLRDMLKLSADKIGLHTQKQRDSFAAANTYITDLGNTAAQAYKSGHGVDAAMKAISNGLPLLDSAKTKSKAYWEEIRTLVAWHDKLARLKTIRELVIVTGQGTWTMHNPKGQSLPGGFPGGTGAARGLKVTGGIPGKDSVPIMAMPGEAVVPTHLVPPLAPFLKANKVPGFAAGGIVPHFSGSVAGEGRWAAADNRASVRGLETGLASIMITAIRHAQKSQLSLGFPGGGGASGPGAAAAQAYARSILGLYGWGRSQFPPLQALWNQESGWRWNATNPISGAYGIPQSLPALKMAAAGPDWRTNPATQIRWGLGYIRGRYGSPAAAEAHELTAGWYDSGTQWLPPGPSIAYNTTGRPERVGGEDLAPLLRENNMLLRKLPGVLAMQLARVQSGRPVAPRPSVFASR
jgi:hypothetical protein